ncbi:CoA-binding protein [Commensalibacter oyaizuii]|uniref:CoA-binding protein n=1 Tax=Commensalibacter oyaizuii TaxID=3043873 RepID=A0ABT6PZV8_9PROT|nr:CoA-binding protein [Commensalibacter sp. TBRC 16381]MDI2090354.1 CoA-binding protein [Commensalibacter sp. TBRC 16381]
MAQILIQNADIIRALTQVKTIALIGASAKPDRPSYQVMGELLNYGFKVIPVNPGCVGELILQQKTVARLSDINVAIDMVDIFRQSTAVPNIVDEVLTLPNRPRILWMQLGIVHEQAATKAINHDIDVVMDRCPVIELGLH